MLLQNYTVSFLILPQFATYLKDELSQEQYEFIISSTAARCEWFDLDFETVPVNKVQLEPIREHFYLEMNRPEETTPKQTKDTSFSMAYDAHTSNGAVALKDNKIDTSYLPLQYSKFHDKLPGFSCEEFCKSMMQILSSGRSDNELQNELFEMLGFEAFELISELLDNRKRIVENVAGKQSNTN